jgi:hypothetical protein
MVTGKASSYGRARMGLSGGYRNGFLPFYPFGLLRYGKRLPL